jgi:ABC-2 type transport system permease protein
MKKIRTIILKEWMEVFRNRMVIFTIVFLPLLMTAIPLALLYSTRGTVSAASGNAMQNQLPQEAIATLCTGDLSGPECFQVFMVNEFMMLFMLVPVIIPANIAAYSIVGEKTTRSLEPLLATPITTVELLVGKCLAAAIPAVVATFASFGIFAAGSWIIVANRLVLAALLDMRWLIAVFIAGPLLALLAVTFAMMVSSRVNDPRVAEQISMVIIVPVMAGFFGQISGLFILNKQIIIIVTVVLAALDALMTYLAVQLFQRESILTRWR